LFQEVAGGRCLQNIPNKGFASKILEIKELASALAEAIVFSSLFACIISPLF
jgi:hypothetical protein